MDRGDEWTFQAPPAAEEVARRLTVRTGWEFKVTPVERGEVAIAATNGEGGLRWAPVGGGTVRVDEHEKMTPYLSWQADAVLTDLGGTADRKLEKPPITLVPWSQLSWWQRTRHGGRGWLVQVVLVAVLAIPVLVVGALFVAGSAGRSRRSEDDDG